MTFRCVKIPKITGSSEQLDVEENIDAMITCQLEEKRR